MLLYRLLILLIVLTTLHISLASLIIYLSDKDGGVLVVDGDGFEDNFLPGAKRMLYVMKRTNNDSSGVLFESMECIYASNFTQTVADQLRGDRVINGEKVLSSFST